MPLVEDSEGSRSASEVMLDDTGSSEDTSSGSFVILRWNSGGLGNPRGRFFRYSAWLGGGPMKPGGRFFIASW